MTEAASASESSRKYRSEITSRSSSRSPSTAPSSSARRSSATTVVSGEGGALGELYSAARSVRPRRRPAALRRFLASLATTVRSHGLKGAPDRNRSRVR